MRLVVTGGAGYVGSHFVWEALDAGHDVVVVDDLSLATGKLLPSEVRLVQCSVGDRARLDPLFRAERFDALVHFAGSSRVAESVSHPDHYFRNNVVASLALFDAAKDASISRVVFSSSAAVYGNPKVSPIPEDAALSPTNPYGESKAMIETVLRRYCNLGWFSAVALRYFNAAGADPRGRTGEEHEPETHLIPNVLKAALEEGPPLAIFGDDYPTPDGTCVRDYVHVTDLAFAHLAALEWLNGRNGYSCFNLGTESGYSVRQVILAIESVIGYPVPHHVAPRRAGDPPILVADAARARRELAWVTNHSDLATIVRTAMEWHRTRLPSRLPRTADVGA